MATLPRLRPRNSMTLSEVALIRPAPSRVVRYIRISGGATEKRR